MKIKMLQNPWWRRAGLLLVASVAGFILIIMATYLYLAPLLPHAEQLRVVDYQIPLRIYSSDQQLIGEFGEKRRTPLTFDQFPSHLVIAVIAAEDERFFRHGGVDLRGLLRAALELLWYQDIRSGGSTITMQVARNFFLDREQKFLRKFNEIVLAIEIENILTKEQILELYLNKIYLGHRSYGAEAAAQVYYGKPLAELSLPQLAMIAGLPKAPSAYNPITNPERALTRRNWILRRMESINAIDNETYLTAKAEPVSASYHGPSPDVDASYLAEMVRQEMLSRFDQEEEVYTSGLSVYVTLDGTLQQAALQSVRNGLHEYDERHGWRGAVSTIEIPDDLPALPLPINAEQDLPDKELETAASTEQPTTQDSSDTATDTWAAINAELSKVPSAADLSNALIVEVRDQSALILLDKGDIAELQWEQISWASAYKNVDYIGDEPQSAADIFSRGDVVRVREIPYEQALDDSDEKTNKLEDPEQQKTVWRLAQIPQVESALVSLNPQTGAINALVGGYSFSQSNFNRAIQGERQAGSAFKPFIYSAGLLNGLTPASLINDAPIVFEDSQLETAWRPTGAGSKFFGPTRIREALYRSLNLVSIRMLQQITIPKAKQTLRELGLPVQRFSSDLSLALGSAAVTPLEIATAYCIFANGGYRVEPWFIDRIEDRNNEILWQAPVVTLCDENCVNNDTLAENDGAEKSKKRETVYRSRVLDTRVAWLMDSMLKDVVRRGTARRATQLGRTDLAGKTGTTNDQLDAWFSGYSPAMVATVWVGFDSPSTLGRAEYGGRAALPIWMQYMGAALDGKKQTFLPQPSGIVSVRINEETGKRARPGSTNAIFEYFRKENLPEEESGTVIEQGSSSSPEQLF